MFIVTGANVGVGKELSNMLYSKNAKVYMAARSEPKTQAAIEEIKRSNPKSSGQLIYHALDLADLREVKASAEKFLVKERNINVLFNNAGVAFPEKGSKTVQGYELQLGVNCLGTFLFTKLLTPALAATAKTAPKDSVRVVWVSSSASEAINPTNFVKELDYEAKNQSQFTKYAMSKLGNYLHGAEYAARHKADGVVSVSLNPGNLDSELWRTQGSVFRWLLRHTVLHPPVFGAYTELFAGLSPAVTMEKSGSFIAPWGRLWDPSSAMTNQSKSKVEGGTGAAQQFYSWTETQIQPYL